VGHTHGGAFMGSDAEKIREAIIENLSGPRQAVVDGVTVQQHSLSDQMKAANQLASMDAMRNPAKAMRRVKIIPPGTV